MHNAYFGFPWNFYDLGTFRCCLVTLEHGTLNVHNAFDYAQCIFWFSMHFDDVGTFHCCVVPLEYRAPIMHDAYFCFWFFFMMWVHFNVVWPLLEYGEPIVHNAYYYVRCIFRFSTHFYDAGNLEGFKGGGVIKMRLKTNFSQRISPSRHSDDLNGVEVGNRRSWGMMARRSWGHR